MPIYEYRCEACGKEQEKLQKMDDSPPPCEHEGCTKRGEPMKRLISRSSFELLGGGWARDGYGG